MRGIPEKDSFVKLVPERDWVNVSISKWTEWSCVPSPSVEREISRTRRLANDPRYPIFGTIINEGTNRDLVRVNKSQIYALQKIMLSAPNPVIRIGSTSFAFSGENKADLAEQSTGVHNYFPII